MTPLYRFLDTDGDGGGTKNVNGDYSTPDDFRITTPAGKYYVIHRMIIHIQDEASGFAADVYGSLASALTNGIEVKTYNADEVEETDLTDGLPIKVNADWGRVCFDVQFDDWGSGEDFLQVRWTFSKSGNPLWLPPGHSLRAELSDNLTGITNHHFMAQGWETTNEAKGRKAFF